MALVASEISRTLNQGTDEPTGQREFLVYEDDSLGPAPSLKQAVFATGVRLYVQDNPPVLANLLPLEYNVKTDLEGPNKFIVTWKYGLDTITVPDINPGDPEFIDFSIVQRPVAVDVWRTGNFLQGGTDSIEQNIGGDQVDAAGEPVTAFITQQDLQIQVRSTEFENIPIGTSLSFLGKRNSSEFFGAPAGYLLYTGLSTQRDGINSYNTTLTFTYDSLAHRRQVPQRESTGEVETELLNANQSTEKRVAAVVHLVQPFPDKVNFENLGVPNPL
jgi:hypothetical protein